MENLNNDAAAEAAALVELTADVVSAYVSNNPVSTAELPNLIGEVHTALNKVQGAGNEPPAEKPKPAVTRRSRFSMTTSSVLKMGNNSNR